MSNITLKWIGTDGIERMCDIDTFDDRVEVGRIQLIKPQGLGDTVKRVIDKVTRGKVKPCGGCKKRQDKLNKLFPYKDTDNGS